MANNLLESPLFEISPKVLAIKKVLSDFVEQECIPAEPIYHAQIKNGAGRWKYVPPVIEELKVKARKLGLWNFFLHKGYAEGPGFSNLEYAVLCEIIGKCHLAAEATNTAAPDTGNMEVLAKYGSAEQKKQWLVPLMEGKIRSAFAMTEPEVASSDATNIQLSITREGNEYVLNGRKWWISGAGDPRCALYIVAGKTDPGNKSTYRQQSIVLVPSNTPGITIVRPMLVYGYDDAPHGRSALPHCRTHGAVV
ncbi:hypothetical protein HDU91_004508 [Kappamyces sp. JEL0680]|nr:hypothetical protein HDU91_004508 [Kappamyces sp. JEL0680]